MADHTPTPWIAASKFSSVVGVPVVARTGESICNTSMPGLPEDWPDHRKRRAEANAAFIVMAVNNYDTMAKALEAARDALACCYNVCDYPASGQSEQDRALAEVNAALQEAERS